MQSTAATWRPMPPASTPASLEGRLPVEFTLLRYEPEPWTVADSLSWIKMMSWVLSVNWETEILRALLIERLGPELAAELEPGCSDAAPHIVREVANLASMAAAGAARPWTALPRRGPSPGPRPARAWAATTGSCLARGRPAGMPLLANDMHLLLALPSIWYENHLVGGDINVTGVTFPGIPGVVSGHNGHVAWGYTNGFPDVQDLYMERLRRTETGGQARVQYEFQGEWLDAEVSQEEIKVKGGETVVEEVIITRHGPIINALAPRVWPASSPWPCAGPPWSPTP